jgi:hypothetical protein
MRAWVQSVGGEFPPVKISQSTTPTVSTGMWSGDTVNTWSAELAGQVYGNGRYLVKTSSLNGDKSQWSLFDNRLSSEEGAQWGSTNYAAGAWAGGTSPRYTLDGSYYGDWVSIQLPEPVALTMITLLARDGAVNRAPSKFRIYGSNDGATWSLIHDQTTALAYTLTMSGNDASIVFQGVLYSHFALVVSALSGDSFLNFNKWGIYGKVSGCACPVVL